MTQWSLEPGCERPARVPRPGSTHPLGVPMKAASLSLTPDQFVARVRAAGGRVDVYSDKIRIYPPDTNVPPINFTNRHIDFTSATGNHRDMIVGQLRRAGIDIAPRPTPKEPDVPSPADIAPQRTPRRDTTSPDDLLSLIAELEQRLSAQEAANANLAERIEALETARPNRGPSQREVLRGIVATYLGENPQLALPPLIIEKNLRRLGRLPEEITKTAVASACASLAERGEIQYGGKTGDDRGLYWAP